MEHGVTLLELMIVTAIIGIIAMLAIPNYQDQIRYSRRSDGLSQLLQLHVQQEAYRIAHLEYATIEQLGLPTHAYYTFAVQNVSPVSFTLTATARLSQTEDSQCASLSLDQSMTKSPALCWP